MNCALSRTLLDILTATFACAHVRKTVKQSLRIRSAALAGVAANQLSSATSCVCFPFFQKKYSILSQFFRVIYKCAINLLTTREMSTLYDGHEVTESKQ